MIALLSGCVGFLIALLWDKARSYERGFEDGRKHERYCKLEGFYDDSD